MFKYTKITLVEGQNVRCNILIKWLSTRRILGKQSNSCKTDVEIRKERTRYGTYGKSTRKRQLRKIIQASLSK